MRSGRKKKDKDKKRPAREEFQKRKCNLCKRHATSVDYKETELLERFITDRGKTISSRITGNCAKHQRQVMRAIKRARVIGLLPYCAE